MPIGFSLMVTAAIAMFIQGIDLIMVPIQIFGGTKSVVLLAIPMFILMGEIMGISNIAKSMIDLASAMVGWMRGGLAHINVVTQMFLAEMSGSAVADAAVTSKIFIPQMTKRGYPPEFSATVTSASATLGIIIPPSIPMVLYGVSTNSSIKDLFLAGIIPGILLGMAFIVTNYIFAWKKQYPTDNHFELKHLGWALYYAFLPMTVPIVVVGSLILGIVTPTEAAGLGVFLCILFLSRNPIESWPKLKHALISTVKQTSVVMMIIAGSAVIGQFLANEQLPQKIAVELSVLVDSPILLLLAINIFLLILGMVLHASAAIIIVVPILLPIVMLAGIDPIHFGVIVCLNLGIGQQTPPVASVLLTVCTISGIKIQGVMKYMKWYLVTMFIVLMIVTFVPQLSLWLK
jgi:tripartite ATP-independent transporter DctM subunit